MELIKEIKLKYMVIKKYGMSEWAGLQVWKFQHPKGWNNLQKLAHGKKIFPPKGHGPLEGQFPSYGNPDDRVIFIHEIYRQIEVVSNLCEIFSPICGNQIST